nr:MAG: ORF1 [TTV-like mini virus]
MHYYRRRYPYRWRRRRWFRPRRSRFAFRRRYWRRYRVRNSYKKRKLSKISLKQFQPIAIRKSYVKGMYPCFLTNSHRLDHNMTQFIDSIAPYHFNGGGGFAITQFTLDGLYELFLKGMNWWTNSNCNLPLVRYNGCKIKLYKAENFDYVALIHRCMPLKATNELYMSSQPQIMMLTKHCIHVPCRKANRNKKNYKTIFVKPPTQYTNKWMFQADMCKQPLLVIQTCIASFDRMFLAADSQSTTMGFISLNTQSFQLHNWNTPPTTGYKPQDKQWLYGTQNGQSNPNEEPIKHLIYLGGTGPANTGIPITNKAGLDSLPTKTTMWGNIFIPHYFSGEGAVYVSTKGPLELKQYYSNPAQTAKLETDKVSTVEFITPKSTPNYINCRYNPLADKGTGNKVYLVSISREQSPWAPPTSPLLIRQDLPLWILMWGFLDWEKKLAETSQIDTTKIVVIESPYITPKMDKYVPLDQSFIDGNSPHKVGMTDYDEKNWYPKAAFQYQSITDICNSGPGTAKLPKETSAEAHYKYTFYFKFGGCPPPMEKICNPTTQAVYPVPNNQPSTPSLQSPTTPIQTYLYDFDERRGQITAKAAKRLKKDYETEKTFLQIAGSSPMDLQAHVEEPTSEPEDSEEEEETLHLKLQRLRRKQKLLRQRILQLLDTQNLE